MFSALLVVGCIWLLYAGPFFEPPPQDQQPPWFQSRCERSQITLDSLLMLDGQISSGEFERRKQAELEWILAKCKLPLPCPPYCDTVPPPPPPPPPPPDTGDYCAKKWLFLDRNDYGKWHFRWKRLEKKIKENCFYEGSFKEFFGVTAQEDTASKYRRYDIIIGAAIPGKTISAYAPPFNLNNAYYSWRDDLSIGISYDKLVWGFLVPSRKTEDVWLVTQSDGVKILPDIKASWFDSKKYIDVLSQLLMIKIQDPSCIITKYESKNNLGFEIFGKYEGEEYIIAVDQNGDINSPIVLSPEGLQRYRSKLTRVLKNDWRLKTMIKNFIENGDKPKITHALPRTTTVNPSEALGGLRPDDKVPPNVVQVLTTGSARNWDLLIDENKVWRYESGSKPINATPAFDHELFTWLSIADPNLKRFNQGNNQVEQSDKASILYRYPKSNIFQFQFQNQPNLWTWIMSEKGGLERQHQTLKGSNYFYLSGISVAEYVTQLLRSARPEEKDFFLSHPAPDDFDLLDVFNVNDPETRVLLVKDNKQSDQSAIFRIGSSADATPIRFYDHNGGLMTNLNSIKSAYLQRRADIEANLIRTSYPEPEVWFGCGKMILSSLWEGNSRMFDLFTDTPKRSFHQVSFNNIETLLRRDRGYVFPHDAPLGRKEFYTSILSDDWRKSIVRWRANPLGYLDRALQENF